MLYVAVSKYVSFSFVYAFVMWSPLAQMPATPSHPVRPYRELHTSISPVSGLHRFALVLPEIKPTARTEDAFQSEAATWR